MGKRRNRSGRHASGAQRARPETAAASSDDAGGRNGRGAGPLHAPDETGLEPGLTLVSASFADGEALPLAHTGDGANVSPPLAWSGVPEDAGSLVLIFEGPDPTGRPGGTFAHWILYNLMPVAGGLDLAADQTGLPRGCRRGRNDFGRQHYIGPVLEFGRHEYRFRLFALDAMVDASAVGEPTWDELMSAVEDHVLAEAELSCFVERSIAWQPSVH
jgi:Raf kinase inhibitor-like YbhB/YbcL family protein